MGLKSDNNNLKSCCPLKRISREELKETGRSNKNKDGSFTLIDTWSYTASTVKLTVLKSDAKQGTKMNTITKPVTINRYKFI